MYERMQDIMRRQAAGEEISLDDLNALDGVLDTVFEKCIPQLFDISFLSFFLFFCLRFAYTQMETKVYPRRSLHRRKRIR